VIVNDVRRDAGWLPNPLLPDTAAELAVPLLAGDKLIGVLDVQADRVNAFSEEDASIQSILASQIAIAIQNVRIYQEIRQKAEREALVGSINQKIQSAVTVEDAMQIAIRELGHALSTQTQIKLYGHNGGK
jgi:GAF domain-containing protein